jgi:tRNA(Ile)-lysidine synthase TilS/MesJ
LSGEHGPGGGMNDDGKAAPGETLLVRPLLSWAKRIATEAFCRDCGVEYRYDTMNEDTAFKRVRIRKILLRLLEDMNPNIIETLSNTAFLMQGHAPGQPPAIEDPDDGHLYLSVLRDMDEARRAEYIRSWLGRRRGTKRQLQLTHIRAIERLALSIKSGRTAEVPGGCVIKKGGRLTYKENQVENKGRDN